MTRPRLVAAYWRGVSDFFNHWHINPYAWSGSRAAAVMWMNGYGDAFTGKVAADDDPEVGK